jgi:hypothetical protein
VSLSQVRALIVATAVAGIALSFAGAAAAQQSSSLTVSGEHVTKEDLKNATAVREFTPQEFATAAAEVNAQECRKGTLHATSDGRNVVLDGTSIKIDEFGTELLRRYNERRFYCVDVVGPGGDAKRVGKIMRELKGSEITSINWRRQDNDHQ